MKEIKLQSIFICLIGIVIFMSIPITGKAEVPKKINYQGYLTDTAGPVNGTRFFTFRIYDSEDAVVGEAHWVEEHKSVRISDGVFSVILGSINPVMLPFDRQYWLGVQIRGETVEMGPRVLLTSVPYALNAERVNGQTAADFMEVATYDADMDHIVDRAERADNADTLNGLNAGEIDTVLTEVEVDAYVADNGYLAEETDPTVMESVKDGVSWSELTGVPSGFADGVDDTGSVVADRDWTLSGTDMYASVTGNTGVGTVSPEAKVHVHQARDGTELLLSNRRSSSTAYVTSTSELKLKATSTLNVLGGPPDSLTGEALIQVDANAKSSPPRLTIDAMSPGMPISFKSDGVERMKINPDGKLEVNGDIQAGIFRAEFGPGTSSALRGLSWDGGASTAWDLLTLENNNGIMFKVFGSGNVQMGSNISIGSNISLVNEFGGGNTGAWMALKDSGKEAVSMAAQNASTGVGGLIDVKNGNGHSTVQLIGDTGTGSGEIRTSVLTITGGADLAEPFYVRSEREIKPGMVLSIDSDNTGRLKIAERPYDRTVAGIVSGAGGINPGLTMRQEGSEASGSLPVSLTGRAYAWTDASNGAIKAGDLLTSSGRPGYAMKVTDYSRAQGAIIGKAMSPLDAGEGLVLVLITLQ